MSDTTIFETKLMKELTTYMNKPHKHEASFKFSVLFLVLPFVISMIILRTLSF